LVVGGSEITGQGCRFQNTLMRVSGETFVAAPEALQTEAFGNSTLIVVGADEDEMVTIAGIIEGSLTGSIYSHNGGGDDSLAERIADRLRPRVGRLLNDKMPTGVAVVPSMNHGGPYPATGHPGFTSVGIPASLRRFALLECYDNVREHRLPEELRDDCPIAGLWRLIDGKWTQT
jgi:NADP-dependent aldehyde dehydrogenase